MSSDNRVKLTNIILQCFIDLTKTHEKDQETLNKLKEICFYKEPTSNECYNYTRIKEITKTIQIHNRDGDYEEEEYLHTEVFFKTSNNEEEKLLETKEFEKIYIEDTDVKDTILWINSTDIDYIKKLTLPYSQKERKPYFETEINKLQEIETKITTKIKEITGYNDDNDKIKEINKLFETKRKKVEETNNSIDNYSKYFIESDLTDIWDYIKTHFGNLNEKAVSYIKTKKDTKELCCRHRAIYDSNISMLIITPINKYTKHKSVLDFDIKKEKIEDLSIEVKCNNKVDINLMRSISGNHVLVSDVLLTEEIDNNGENIFILITNGTDEINWEPETMTISKEGVLSFFNNLSLIFGLSIYVFKQHIFTPMQKFDFSIDDAKYKIPNFEEFVFIETEGQFIQIPDIPSNTTSDINNNEEIKMNDIIRKQITRVKFVFFKIDDMSEKKEFIFDVKSKNKTSSSLIKITGEDCIVYYDILKYICDSLLRRKYYSEYYELISSIYTSKVIDEPPVGCVGALCRRFGTRKVHPGGKLRKTKKRQKTRRRRQMKK